MANLKFSAILGLLTLSFLVQSVFSIRVCPELTSYDNPFSTGCYDNPDGERNISQIIQSWGYTVTEYRITTEDGYILNLVRAVNPNLNFLQRRRSPILFASGFLANANYWVVKGNKSLHYQLGQIGYETWSINWRGTRPSKTHVTLQNNQLAYWNFSFYEMSKYDLPAILTQVNRITGQKCLFVANSMGSTVGLALAADRPDFFSNYVRGFVPLAPVAYIEHAMGSLLLLIAALPVLRPLTDATSAGELAGILATNIPHDTIAQSGAAMLAVETAMFSAFGFDFEQIDSLALPVTTSIARDSAAIKNIEHFGQLVQSGRFQQYDYGYHGNLAEYNETTPPLINVTRITVRTVFFTALNDLPVQLQDAQRLYYDLPVAVRCGFNIVPYPNFNHVDYIEARDVDILLNQYLIRVLNGLDMNICITL